MRTLKLVDIEQAAVQVLDRAEALAKMVLHDNAVAVYGLAK